MTAEAKLRTWGCHWRARLERCPTERLSFDRPEPELKPGDVLKEIEILAERFPRMGYEQAKEAVKYAPMPRSAPMTPRTPGMAQLEMEVSTACKKTGDLLWERYWSENGRYPEGSGMPSCRWQGRLLARIGVRFLVREVYVIGTGVRGKWPGSSFDFLYPYSRDAKDRKNESGREATICLVKFLLDS